MAFTIPSLVAPAWVRQRLNDPGVRILDGSWYMPAAKRNPAKEFSQERIPGSKFFDMDRIADTSSSLPHMLPSADSFAAAADMLGIGNDSIVIVYDRAGIFSSPRVWWTFRAFGHDRVAVLDGGYPAWQAAGFEVDRTTLDDDDINAAANAAQNPPAGTAYKAILKPHLVRNLEAMLENVKQSKEAVVDARGADRFAGTAPEPRAGVRSGHMPGSLNLPFGALLQDGRYKEPEALKEAFNSAGLAWDRPIITSCGTGVTASILALGLHLIDPSLQVSVYDGSWTEWGGLQDTPVDTS